MTTLSTLKLTNTKKSITAPPTQTRRLKLSKRLWEQIELARAEKLGTTFSVKRFRSYTERDTGIRKQIEINKRIKHWWFVGDNGKLNIAVKYGNRVLELAKGKFAVEVDTAEQLIPTLEIIKQSVERGELDKEIAAAANLLRDGFAK